MRPRVVLLLGVGAGILLILVAMRGGIESARLKPQVPREECNKALRPAVREVAPSKAKSQSVQLSATSTRAPSGPGRSGRDSFTALQAIQKELGAFGEDPADWWNPKNRKLLRLLSDLERRAFNDSSVRAFVAGQLTQHPSPLMRALLAYIVADTSSSRDTILSERLKAEESTLAQLALLHGLKLKRYDPRLSGKDHDDRWWDRILNLVIDAGADLQKLDRKLGGIIFRSSLAMPMIPSTFYRDQVVPRGTPTVLDSLLGVYLTGSDKVKKLAGKLLFHYTDVRADKHLARRAIALLSATDDKDMRAGLLRLLGKSELRAATYALLNIAESSGDPKDIRAAGGRSGDAQERLTAMYYVSLNPRTKRAVLEALSNTSDNAVLGFFEERLYQDTPSFQAHAARSLATHSNRKRVRIILTDYVMAASSSTARAAAYYSLSLVGNKDTLRFLEGRLLDTRDSKERASLQGAIKVLRGRGVHLGSQ